MPKDAKPDAGNSSNTKSDKKKLALKLKLKKKLLAAKKAKESQ